MLNSPRSLLMTGFLLLFAGWLIPLLTIMNVLGSTFWLNFLSWSMSVTGLFMGFMGGAMLVKMNKED